MTEQSSTSRRWPRGFRVRVRNRFDGTWTSGFAIDDYDGEHGEDGTSYVLRRLSDDSTLPVAFTDDQLFPES